MMTGDELEDRLMEAPIPVLRYIRRHAWNVADRTFKLVAWMAGIAALQTLAKSKAEYSWIIISLVALWWLSVFVSVLGGVGSLMDEMLSGASKCKSNWVRVFFSICVGVMAVFVAVFLLKAFGNLFSFVASEGGRAVLPSVPGRP
jgi:hypothetical protein